MSLLESLKRGFWGSFAEPYELLAGGAGLLESLIPGDSPDDPLERLKDWSNERAQGLRLEAGTGESEGLLEKIAEGLGAAPMTLATMAPFMMGGGAVAGAGRAGASLGSKILGPAIGFGTHSLIRHGDEGLPTAIGHGLKGAAEGAIFGGIGAKTGSMFAPQGAGELLKKVKYLDAMAADGSAAAARLSERLTKQLAETGINTAGRQLGRKAMHGAGAGGVVGGMTLAHGGSLEDAAASGATMGLLGMLSSGKYRTPGATTEEMLGAMEGRVRRAAERRPLKEVERLAREPHEIPFDEFQKTMAGEYNSAIRMDDGVVFRANTRRGQHHGEAYNRAIEAGYKESEMESSGWTFGPKNTYISEAEIKAHAGANKTTGDPHSHMALITKAINDGKKIPLEVLADHPELLKVVQETSPQSILRAGEPTLTDVARGAKPYDSSLRTKASREQFDQLDPTNQKLFLEKQNEGLQYPLEAYQRVAITPGQTFELQSRMTEIQQQKAQLAQHRAQAKAAGDKDMLQVLNERESDLLLQEVSQFEPMSGSQTQAGRALVNIRWARRDQPEWVDAVKSFEKQFGAENAKRFKNLAMLSEGDPALLQKLTSIVNRPKAWDYMMEYWINGLLSGPTTQAVNISSNMLRQGVDYAERSAALRAESLTGATKLTQGDIGMIMGADRSAAWAAAKLLPRFVKAAFSEAEKIKLVESDRMLQQYSKRTKIDHPTAAIPGKPGQVIRIPGNMLQVMDLYFKAIAGQRAAAYTSTRKAYEMFRNNEIKETEIEGKIAEFMGEATGEPAKFVLDAMKKEADVQTFTQEITASFGKAVAATRNVDVKLPILGLNVKPGMAVVPFWQTPWNVVTSAVTRSPLGLLRMKELTQKYKNGDIAPQEYYREVAATTMGTALWASLVATAKMGGITGGGPVNQQDRQNLLSTGWRPYSIKLGDTYHQLQRLEPFGTVLGLAADAAEFGSSDDKTGKAIAIVKDNLTDKSFLYGLESFAKAFANPEQFGSTYYRQMAGSIVPTFFSKAAQAADPYQRVQEPFGSSAGVPDALAYRIPGVSRALPARTTAFGEKAERWGVMSADTPAMTALSAAQSMVSPVPASAERQDRDVEREFNRLRGFDKMPPATPKRSKRITMKGGSGETVKLTPQEYAIYDKWHLKAKDHLAQIIQGPAYARMPDAMKASVLRKTYDKYRSAANKEIALAVRKRTTVGE